LFYQELVGELTGRPAGEKTGCVSCHVAISDGRLAAVRGDKGYRLRDPELEKRLVEKFPDSEDRQRVTRTIMSHPRLDKYLSPGSPHPYPELSCAACHGIEDRRADPSLTVSQRKTWGSQYMSPRPGHEQTMPVSLLSASCARCHGSESPHPGADLFNTGLLYYERSGCYGCHKSPGMVVRDEDLPLLPSGESDLRQKIRRPGPPLVSLPEKVGKKWAYNWILNPVAFQAGARMPSFFPRGAAGWPEKLTTERHPRFLKGPLVKKTDAPAIYPKGYDIDEVTEKTLERVIAACLAEYLYSIARPIQIPEVPKGLLKVQENLAVTTPQQDHGRNLAFYKGCFGCHRFDEEQDRDPEFERALKEYSYRIEDFAPTLGGSGDKFSGSPGIKWLFNWLKNPHSYFPKTWMPDYGLTDSDAAAITAYLLTRRIDNPQRLKNKQTPWEPADPPLRIEGKEVVIDPAAGKAFEYLWSHPNAPKRPPSGPESVLRYGEHAFEFFGCYGCHEAYDPARGERDWTRLPILDQPLNAHLTPVKGVMERMPMFQSTQTELDLGTNYMLAAAEADRRGRGAAWTDQKWGEALVRRYNCAGCHVLEGPALLINDPKSGSQVWCECVVKGESAPGGQGTGDYFVDWLLDPSSLKLNPLQELYDNSVPAKEVLFRKPARGGTLLQRMAVRHQVDPLVVRDEVLWPLPPSLRDVKRKVNREWLAGFLRTPVPIRPFPQDPMPNFKFSEEEIQAIVAYFGPEPREADRPAPENWKEIDAFVRRDCLACHTLDGAGKPPTPALVRPGDGVEDGARKLPALDLALSTRLTRPWLSVFLKAPHLLLPRTGMPQLAREVREDPERMERLLDYLLHYPKVRLQKIKEGDLSMALESMAGISTEEEARSAAGRCAKEKRLDLMEAFLLNRNPNIRGIAIRELTGLRLERAATAIALYLIDQDPAIISEALWAMGELKAVDQVPGVAQLLWHSSENVRRKAIDTLVVLQARGQIGLIVNLLSDKIPAVRLTAVDALVALQDNETAADLKRVLSDEHPAIRGRAALALSGLKVPDGANELVRLIDDRDPTVRWYAAVSLARMGREEAVAAFDAALRATPLDWLTPEVLREGANELNVLGSRAVFETLRKTPIGEGEKRTLEWVREAARLTGLELEVDEITEPLLNGQIRFSGGGVAELLAEITRRQRVFFVIEGTVLRPLPIARAVALYRNR
jgi:HEAT repeat protein/cytochrome c2